MDDRNRGPKLKVEIAKVVPGDPSENDRIIERIPCEEPENRQSKNAHFSPPKPTVFDLYNAFTQYIPCANIDGMLHILDQSKGYYVPVSQREIEELLLDRFYHVVVASGSPSIAKKCAELIVRKKPTVVTSADKQHILCFQNGYLPLTNLENTGFYPYSAPVGFCPTYLINATGHVNMHNWGLMKTLKTTAMDTFLDTIACGNPKVVMRIWQMIGYLLTPDTSGKCFFLLQGVPNSGKSVLGNLIKSLISEHRIVNLDIDQLGKKNATSLLVNKSINISMDLPNKTLLPLAIRNIKLITGNDDLTVEYGNGTYASYRGNCKFLFATNHALTLKGADLGLEERIVCIPFLYSIPAVQRDRNLLTSLLNEHNEIVAKALAYYRDLRNNNYIFAGSELPVCKAKIRYLPIEAEDMDATLCQFVEECCEFVSTQHRTHTHILFAAYQNYCKENGHTPIDNMAAFSRRLYKCYRDQLQKDKWRDTECDGIERNQNGFRGIALQAMIPIGNGYMFNV